MPGTVHAAVRAAERLGIVADRKWFDEVVDQILSGKATRVRYKVATHLDEHNLVYDVVTSTGRARVVFDPRLGQKVVVTVLPLGEFRIERYHRQRKQEGQRKREFFRGFDDEE